MDKTNGEQVILLSIEDITDQRKVEDGLAETERMFNESQERIKLAVEAAELGAWDYDPATGEFDMNEHCREILDLQSPKGIGFDFYLDHVHPDDIEKTREHLTNALSGIENGVFEHEYRIRARHNNIRWIRAKG